MHQAQAEHGGRHSATRGVPWQSAFAFALSIALTSIVALPAQAAEEERRPPPPSAHVAPPSGGHPMEQHMGSGPGGPGGRPGYNPGPRADNMHGNNFAGHGVQQHYGFQGHDVRHFNEHDLGIWRGGAWHHEYHNGRYGYWWFAGGAWYFYDQPVYPYPLVVSDSFYFDPDPVAPPPQVIQPPQGYWYYCDNPPGYYPYITSCYSPYRLVPAQPY